MGFVKAGQDEFRKQEQGVISRVIELVQSQNELTQRTACHCAYQISKGNFVNQSLLIRGGIVPLLVTMVRPPMSVGSQTASWCIAALGEIAQDDGSREILRNEGAVAALMELGTRAETEYLRRSASEVYAACTTPGWTLAMAPQSLILNYRYLEFRANLGSMDCRVMLVSNSWNK